NHRIHVAERLKARVHAEACNRGGDMPRLARIVIYPFKSFDGLDVPEARVLPSGALQHDRQFALLDARGEWVNGKRTPRIHLLRSVVNMADRRIRLSAGGPAREFGIDADREALEGWLSEFLGMAVRVTENSDAGFPDDTVSPGPTVVSTATLGGVAAWFGGLPFDEVRQRFRANLEIEGVDAFWEDRLYGEEGDAVRFQIGDVLLEGTNPCHRSPLPTRSP